MARSRRLLRRGLFAVACTAPLLVACNTLLGISDYSKEDCNGGGSSPCFGVDGGVDSPFDAPTDAPNDAPVIVDARGADPVSWARWIMPNHGNVATVPDATIPSLNSGADGGLVDSISGLVWRPIPDAEKGDVKFEAARKLCAEAPPAGQWRLPTRIELVSLLDLSRSPVMADPKLNLQAQPYWTSSEYRTVSAGNVVSITTQNWGVRFEPNQSSVLPRLDTVNDTARTICILGK